jgi:hypothetical protein
MAITLGDVHTKLEDAVTALEAYNFTLARIKIVAARTLLMGVADVTTDEQITQYRRRADDLARLINETERSYQTGSAFNYADFRNDDISGTEA